MTDLPPRKPRPGEPPRSIRISDKLWDAAMNVAKLRGDNLSAEIRKFLERYVKKGTK